MTPVDEGTATQPTTEMESVESLTGRPAIESILGTVWTHKQAVADKRAPLRVYLGAAPGVGKTYAMLDEGQRRLERGTRSWSASWRPTADRRRWACSKGSRSFRPKTIEYRGVTPPGDGHRRGRSRRHPEVALVDELAHTNVPGSRRAKRWEDVLDVLPAGIEVITT